MLGPERRDRKNSQSTKGQRKPVERIRKLGEIRINNHGYATLIPIA